MVVIIIEIHSIIINLIIFGALGLRDLVCNEIKVC